MSESAIEVDLLLVDRVAPEVDRLLSDLASIVPIEIESDPVVTAVEAAVAAARGVAGMAPLTAAVLRLMPPHTTPFERGLALGMALILAVRPAEG